ncbi:Hsp70 family protein [Rhodococcus chondri]|uniref:Hsp70 family protein n=1 Tax=Rhodococcus chondri TaxID=3065941 RepID=A0ABU7JV31_9NOCA|nr:Hsp70 family protein [Rhodococcus sp. CC-R104]MEE2033876.1 Hsp70 family protein [Rhodococcus sp. CC-R104]
MPTSLGISVGASGVGSASIVDTAVGRHTEYRRLALEPDQHRDLGDLVFDAISLTTRIDDHPKPETITVAYRTDEQADAIRAAAVREGQLVRLVPETTALSAFLRSLETPVPTGAAAIADVGASGMTVSVLDHRSGTVLRSSRTTEISGEILGSRIYGHVRRATDRMRTRMQIDPVLLAARCQGAQEVLTTADTARIDIGEAGPETSVTLNRADLDTLTADLAVTAAEFVQQVCRGALPRPGSLTLLGGAAGMPSLAAALGDTFDGPVVTVPEPASAAAQGAALLGGSPEISGFPLVGVTETRSGSRMPGAVAVALVVAAIIAGFAMERFTPPPNNPPVSPAGTYGTVPTEQDPPAPTETRIPSRDPGSSSVDTRTPDDSYTAPLPLSTTTRSPHRDTRTSEMPRPTVTPTPIDQVPTPGSMLTPETTEDGDPTLPFVMPSEPIRTDPPQPDPTDPAGPTTPTDPTDPSDTPEPTGTTTPAPSTETSSLAPSPTVPPTTTSQSAAPPSTTTTGYPTVTGTTLDSTTLDGPI